MNHARMFVRLLTRAALVQPGRMASALLAVLVASSAASAMMLLYADAQAKLGEEFRDYGANIVIVAPRGGALPADALATADRVLGARGVAVPFAYAVARTNAGQPVIVAGTDLERVRRLDTWWSVTAWPKAANDALLGTRAAKVVTPDNQSFALTFAGRTLTLVPAGRLRTGAAEDSRIYLDLRQFEQWTGVQPSSIEIAVAGTPSEIETTMQAFRAALPGAEVRPVRQMVEGEARVLDKTRATLLAAIAIIILTATLSVAATLTTWLLDSRRDFAVMKALGASQRLIHAFYAAEVAGLGALGAVVGFVIGLAVAAWIARANFHQALTPRWSVFPAVLAGGVVLALLSSLLPLRLLRRVQPAVLLKGE